MKLKLKYETKEKEKNFQKNENFLKQQNKNQIWQETNIQFGESVILLLSIRLGKKNFPEIKFFRKKVDFPENFLPTKKNSTYFIDYFFQMNSKNLFS